MTPPAVSALLLNPANAPFVRAYLWRGARIWLLSRALFSAALRLGGINPFHVRLSMALWMIGVSVALAWVESRRKHERAFLQNLGVPAHVYSALVAAPAIAGEAALALAWMVLG